MDWCDNTLQRQNAENLKQIFPEKEYKGLSPNFHIHVSVSELYIPTMGRPVLLEEICRLILGISKSLKDTWMWTLGLRPRYSQKRNIWTELPLQCRTPLKGLADQCLLPTTFDLLPILYRQLIRGPSSKSKGSNLDKEWAGGILSTEDWLTPPGYPSPGSDHPHKIHSQFLTPTHFPLAGRWGP